MTDTKQLLGEVNGRLVTCLSLWTCKAVEDHSITTQEIQCDASLMGSNEDRLAYDGNQNKLPDKVNGKVGHLSQ